MGVHPQRAPRRRYGFVSDNRPMLPSPDVMPASDPAGLIISAILAMVPASRWAFARIDPKGALTSPYGSLSNANRTSGLADELHRQRIASRMGPRIAATLGSLEGFTSGITLVFADAHADFGILTLLRSTELGPFTSTEISVLTFALDAASENLGASRLSSSRKRAATPAPETSAADGASDGAFYVLDADLHIVMAWSSKDRCSASFAELRTRIEERLPTIVEASIRELTSAWGHEAANASGIAYPVPFLAVRTQSMTGPDGQCIGVRIDRVQPQKSLITAAARYHISPREVQVLGLLLDGNHLDQIALQLHITSSTVQDHIKSMLDKTASRNRSELIARVLGWESSSNARAT